MAPNTFQSSSYHKAPFRSETISTTAGEPSDLTLVRPLRTSTRASTSSENAGPVSCPTTSSPQVSKEAISRWTDHVNTLSEEQRQVFLREDPGNDLVKYAKAVDSIIDDKLKASKVVRATKWIEPLVAFVEMCRPLTDSLGGIYPPAGLVLGGVFAALSVTKRVVKYQEALVQFLTKVMSSLGQLNKFRTAFPDTPEIQTGLVDVFDIILQICAQASTLFIDHRGKGKSSSRLFWRSFEKDFGDWKQILDISIETFDRTVQLVSGQKLGELQEAQMMGLRMQLETYRTIHKNETRRMYEEHERELRQIQRDQDEKRTSLLNWLSSLSFQTTHNSILANTLEETGRWLSYHETYISWRAKSREALLWVHGKHGSGKTHLAARVIEELRLLCLETNAASDNGEVNDHGDYASARTTDNHENFLHMRPAGYQAALIVWKGHHRPETAVESSSENANWSSPTGFDGHRSLASDALPACNRIALAYIYCSSQQVQRSDKLKTGRGVQPAGWYDTTGLLGCLLKQLYQFLPNDQDVLALRNLCFETRADQPSREDIMNGIKSVVSMFSQTFIVVDGLDECSGVSNLEFEAFCTFLASLANLSITGPSANVLIFSRPGYQAITIATHGCLSIEVDQGANAEDISLFIDDRSGELTRDLASLKEIQDHLLHSADGMSLWVSLVIDSIKQERTAKKMKAAARNMPRGLTGAYADALKRIIATEPSIKHMALKALLWTANSKKSLSKSQLLEVLAIEDGMSSIGTDERLDDDIPLTKDCADLLVLKDGQYMLLHPSLGEFLKGLSNTDLEGLGDYRDLQTDAPRILANDCLTYLNFDTFARGPMPTEASLKELFQNNPFVQYAGVFWGDHLRDALDRDIPSLRERSRELLRSRMSRGLLHQIYIVFSNRESTIFPFPHGTTPLHILSIFGLHELVRDYSGAEVDIDQADGFGNFPLDYAAQNGHQAMTSKIVDEHISRTCGISQGSHRRCNSKSWLMGTIVLQHWTDLMVMLLKLGHSTAGTDTLSPTALHFASSCGHTDMVERLLIFGAQLDTRDGDGHTPLMIAAQRNHVGTMFMLLEKGANVRCRGHSGLTALHMVSSLRNCNEDLAAALLAKGSDIEARAWSAETPLHFASAFGSERLITFLLDRGANQEAVTESGVTPLLIASSRGRSDAVRLLLARGANIMAVDQWSNTTLHKAASSGNVKTMSLLLDVPASRKMLDWQNSRNLTPLCVAASTGSTACAKRLLDEGANINFVTATGGTPLLISLYTGHKSLAQMLVGVYNADPHYTDFDGLTAMHVAAMHGHADGIQMLLSWGVEPSIRDKHGRSPLHHAIARGHVKFVEGYIKSVPAENVLERQRDSEPLLHSLSENGSHEVIKRLIEWKPALGLWRSEDGDLAIHRAVAFGKIACVKYLCNTEVINIPGANGKTPLHYAAVANDPAMVKYFLERGADVNGGQSSEPSPLIEASRSENEEIINMLLDWGADVESGDRENWRPIHYATAYGRTQLTYRLLDEGCEPEPQTDEGDTPFFLACYNNHTEVINLFLTRGFGNITIQSFTGSTYAHVTAFRGRQDTLQRLIYMDKSTIAKTDWADFDALSIAAYAGEPAVVQLLIRCGASPDGPVHTKVTPLAFAAMYGSISIVDLLMRAGAKVDKTGAILRTPLMWAVTRGYVKTAHRLLNAGANPFLRDDMGLSAFDLAVGQPAMVTILEPWNKTFDGTHHQHDVNVYSLSHFVSRAAKTLAYMAEQGVPYKKDLSCSLDISMIYFQSVQNALSILMCVDQDGQITSPASANFRKNFGSRMHTHSRDTRTAVPVRRAGIIKDYRLLYSDLDAKGSCGFCHGKVNKDFYVCSVCRRQCCSDCQHALSRLSSRERSESFGQLRRLEIEVGAVLEALRPIAHQDARLLGKVLSQGTKVQHWVNQRIEDYWKIRSSRKFYNHLQQDDFFGWEAVHIMSLILALSSRQAASKVGSLDSKYDEDVDENWRELTVRWHDLFAFNSIADEAKSLCTHHCRKFSKVPWYYGDAALDSSGRLTVEFFNFLARKYETAMDLGTESIRFLQSTCFSENLVEDLEAEKSLSLRAEGVAMDPNSSEKDFERGSDDEVYVDKGYENTSDTSDDSSTESSESAVVSGSLEVKNGTAIDIEDSLDHLLGKRKLLMKQRRLTDENEVVLNTAWMMAQAIVYQDTPRPSLKDICDQGAGYYTAPSTPASSDGGSPSINVPSSYGTPRSISPVSLILDRDE